MVIDSDYTNPDKLRNRYTNPRNPTSEIDSLAQSSSTEAQPQILSPNPSNNLPIIPGGHYCPYAFDFVIASSRIGLPLPILAVSVRAFETKLWNPLSKNFNLVIHSELIKKVPCYEVISMDGIGAIVSDSHPLIRNMFDWDGLELKKFTPGAQIVSTNLSSPVLNFIREINYIGLRNVQWITLETEKVYASGRKPNAFLLGHNKAQNPDDIPDV